MAVRDKNRFWRHCGKAFRGIRIAVLFIILCMLVALLYLNQVGLPGFVKEPLLQKLRARGVVLAFSRLRWHWERGIVAENVHFGGSNPSASPIFTIKEVRVRLNYAALARLQFQVDALSLREGRLILPVASTNSAPHALSITNIQTELRLLPGDLWELDHFQAGFKGGDLQVTATVTNASAARNWRFFQPSARIPAGALPERLRPWADALERIHFIAPPQLKLELRGDARDLQSFVAEARLTAPDAETPWGDVQRGLAIVHLAPSASNELSAALVTIQAGRAQTRWATVSNLDMTLHLLAAVNKIRGAEADVDLAAGGVETKWGQTARAHLTAHWVHDFTNAIPNSGRGRLELEGARTQWGEAAGFQVDADFFTPSNAPAPPSADWAWWTNLAPYAIRWDVHADELRSPRLQAKEVSSAGNWLAPDLEASRVTARLYGGEMNARARLHVPTRELTFKGESDFDVQKISALLTEKSRHWLEQYSWERPPELEASGGLILPQWTNRHPDWRGEVKPTVRLQGHFNVGQGAFRGVSASGAESHFNYSNEVWRLPDLVVTRPEGRLEVFHESNERTRDYQFRVHSTIDVRALRPLLDARQQHGLDLVGFGQSPDIDGEVWGRWYDLDRLGFKAHVSLNQFSVRGEPVDAFHSDAAYTNRVLRLIQPRIERAGGAEQMSASVVDVDFPADRIYVTNGVSTVDPQAAGRAMGPHVSRAIEPYHFLRPPTVRVSGMIPTHDERDADLHFEVDGGPFQWWRFRTRRISGKVDWVKDQLALRDVQAAFYGGRGAGRAEFDFHRDHGASFSFKAAVADADLHQMMADLSGKTNHLEGLLTGRFEVGHAESEDKRSWEGEGNLGLRDGLIWDIPIFGIFSPALDAIMPGLGSSRASEGLATFTLSKGVIYSDDLEIRASMMRLRYWGSLDLDGKVNAQAEAELLRDTWMFGRVISIALWPVSKLFEYQISGTVQEPKSAPIFFVPKLVLFPFHPIRTLRDLVPEPSDLESTNGPPLGP